MIIVICAWCNQKQGEKEGDNGESHTLCLSCKAEHFPDYMKPEDWKELGQSQKGVRAI